MSISSIRFSANKHDAPPFKHPQDLDRVGFLSENTHSKVDAFLRQEPPSDVKQIIYKETMGKAKDVSFAVRFKRVNEGQINALLLDEQGDKVVYSIPITSKNS